MFPNIPPPVIYIYHNYLRRQLKYHKSRVTKLYLNYFLFQMNVLQTKKLSCFIIRLQN